MCLYVINYYINTLYTEVMNNNLIIKIKQIIYFLKYLYVGQEHH